MQPSREQLLGAKNYFEAKIFDPLWSSIEVKEAPRLMAQAVPQNITNIVGAGIGQKITYGEPTGQMSLRIYVIQKVPEDELPEDLLIPREIEGIPTDIVTVGRPILRKNDFYLRPARGGTSIGNINEHSAGTLGCLVRREGDEEILFLSNNHVLAMQNQASPGDEIVQPGKYDGGTDVIATLEHYIPVTVDSVTPNFVDAAVAKPIKPDLVSGEIIGIGHPKGVTEPTRYRWVVKCGRTTELTKGYIDDVDVTIQIPFGMGMARGMAKFTDQILIWGIPPKEYYDLPTAQHVPSFSDSGDSGSAVVDERTGHVVGLLFAGSDSLNVTYANKITNVESALRVRIAWI